MPLEEVTFAVQNHENYVSRVEEPVLEIEDARVDPVDLIVANDHVGPKHARQNAPKVKHVQRDKNHQVDRILELSGIVPSGEAQHDGHAPEDEPLGEGVEEEAMEHQSFRVAIKELEAHDCATDHQCHKDHPFLHLAL